MRSRRCRGRFRGVHHGNVASNLLGRLLAAALADHLGLAGNFYVFSALNLAGAVLVHYYLRGSGAAPMPGPPRRSAFAAWREHLENPPLARGVRHRLLHPLRLHRHVHVRQLRAGARAAVACR
jgi:hypothetical protein